MKTNIGMPRSAARLLAMFELDKASMTRHARLILVETHDDGKYVVSLHYGDGDEVWDGSWAQGHYFDDIDKARDYFVERCAEAK